MPGAAHLAGIVQVQLHAADVRLVGDGFRVELQHHRVADFSASSTAASSLEAICVSMVAMP